jgi:hypothetical protein
MKKQQVFHIHCAVCGCRIGCYDSYRNTPKRHSCDDCYDYCPDANEPASHGMCVSCFLEAMDRITQKKMTEVRT